MGEILFVFIAAVIAIQIFRMPGAKKLPWFFAGILFFPKTIILLVGTLNFQRFIIYFFLLVFLVENRDWWRKFKTFPLWQVLIIVFFALLSIGLIDQRHSLYLKLFNPVDLFITNFLVLFLTYHYIRTINDLFLIFKVLIIFFLIFAMYGIINFLLKENVYYSFISNTYGGRDFGNAYNLTERFRISSFAYHAIYYGLLLDVIILVITFLIINFRRNRPIYFILLSLLFLNLFLVNSRTPIFSLAVGFTVFFLFGINFKQKILSISIGLLLIIGIFNFVPTAKQFLAATYDTFFSDSSDLEGSSLEMREMQLAASLVIFNQRPVFGNGFNYIVEDLGYSGEREKRNSDNDLKGFESYAYVLLIEQGMIGVIANVLFFVALALYSLKKYGGTSVLGKKISILCFSVLLMFLSFIIGTGALNSFPFVMSFIGVCVKGIHLSQFFIKEHSLKSILAQLLSSNNEFKHDVSLSPEANRN